MGFSSADANKAFCTLASHRGVEVEFAMAVLQYGIFGYDYLSGATVYLENNFVSVYCSVVVVFTYTNQSLRRRFQ